MKTNLIQDKKVFYAGLIYFITVVLYITARIIWSAGAFSALDPIFNDLLFSTIVQVFIVGGFPFFMWKILNKQTFKQTAERFFFKKVSFKTILASLALGVLLYILIIFVSTFWNTLIGFLGYTPSSGSATTSLPTWLAFLITTVSTALMPGFCEETSNRGLLLGNMRNNGLKRAILLSALMFGLMHLNIMQFGHAFVSGLVLGAVTYISRSIFPAMIMHGVSNFCSVYLDYATAYNWWGGGIMEAVSNFFLNSSIFVSLILSFLIFAIVLVCIAMLISVIFVENKRSKFARFRKNLYESVKGTEMENSINFNNTAQMLDLYNKASASDLKDKIESGKIPLGHLEHEVAGGAINTMIYSEIDEYKKPNPFDYIFYYMSICMMTIITIATFIWGAL